MGISWDEVEEDRRSWRNRVAQCVFDAGRTRNQEPGYIMIEYIAYISGTFAQWVNGETA